MDDLLGLTIHMKASEQNFPEVLFIMLYKVVLTFVSVDNILKCDQMKATGQNFPVVLFFMLYKMVLPLQSVDEILDPIQMKSYSSYSNPIQMKALL